MMIRTTLLGTALMVLMAGGPAHAQASFEDWNADNEGGITQEEFRTAAEEAGLFSLFETDDEDQTIGQEEFAEGLYQTLNKGEDPLTVSEFDTGIDRLFGEQAVDLNVSEWDDDGDGVISQEEFQEQIGESGLFAMFDADQDETVTEDEFLTGWFDTADADDDEAIAEDEFLFDDFLF